MLEAIVSAFAMMFQPLSLLGLLIGVLFGIMSGAMPGGSIPGLVIILSFAYVVDPTIIIPMAVGVTAVTSSSDTIPAVLLGVPGSSSGQATILDGYQLAKKGRAGEALGAAYAASLIGGLVGTLALFVTIPFARSIIKVFAAPEFMMLSIVGVAIVAVLSSGAMLKGLIAGLFGLSISIIGFDPISGFARGTFELSYLWDGISIIPVILGLFAIPELIDMTIKNTSISRVSIKDISRDINKGLLPGIRAVLRHKFLVVRSSLLGAFIGFMPGMGGSVANWLAYTQARMTEKGAKQTFGTGDIRGVIAPESSNNSVDGGSFIPTLAFSIPGSVSMTIMLGLLILMGFQPGPQMLTTHLDITLLIIYSLAFANVIATVLLLFATPYIAKAAFVRANVLVPITICILFIVAFTSSNSLMDLVMMGIFVVIGWFMKVYKWPRPPLIIALVLGGTLEKYMYISFNTFGFSMLLRPSVLIIVAVSIFMVWYSKKISNRV